MTVQLFLRLINVGILILQVYEEYFKHPYTVCVALVYM